MNGEEYAFDEEIGGREREFVVALARSGIKNSGGVA